MLLAFLNKIFFISDFLDISFGRIAFKNFTWQFHERVPVTKNICLVNKSIFFVSDLHFLFFKVDRTKQERCPSEITIQCCVQ